MVSNSCDIKIEYFPGLFGRAEPHRMMCAFAGNKWNEAPVKDWAKVKGTPDYPGGLPMVTVDGLRMQESMASMRALAIRFGLFTNDSTEAHLIDSTFAQYTELLDLSLPIHLGKPDPELCGKVFKTMNEYL